MAENAAMPQTNIPINNRILASLPAKDWDRWLQNLERVDLSADDVIYESGQALSHIYFPLTCILSVTRFVVEGDSVELAMIGNEGVAGAASLMGNETSFSRVGVLRAGVAYRLSGTLAKKEMGRSTVLMQQILRFSQSLITQMAQVSVCNCHHTLEQRLCRWMLVYADRAGASPILCTQEQLAFTLGVRRERLAIAARALQKKELIRYARGAIEWINREGVEKHACECYALIRLAYAQGEEA